MRPVSRRHLLIALMTAPAVLGLGAQPLLVHLDGDYVHVAAPHLQFLTGKTLDRLHDGASVAFLGQLTLSLDANVTVQTRSIARYALSYDIWEEKFSVTRIQQTRRTVSHLSLDAAQDWIVDNLTLNASDVPPDHPFWLRFELRAEDPHDGLGVIGGSGISLTRLIEVFSRPAGAAQPRWTLDVGPLSRGDLHLHSQRGT
jgi:hypothetical protein